MAESVSVELVDVEAADGFQYVAGLAEPVDRRGGPVDAFVIHPGATGAFYNSTYRAWLRGLPARGYPVLVMNSRGSHTVLHDMAARPHPLGEATATDQDRAKWEVRAAFHGSAVENLDDSRHDIRGAIDAMEERGYSRIALMGHSLGGVKVVLYAARELDPRVKALIVASHPRFSADLFASRDESGAYARTVEKARRVAAAGGELDLMLSEFPYPTLVGATPYLRKYADDTYDALLLASAIDVPILGLVGEREKVMASPEITSEFVDAATSAPRRKVYIVPDGDHAYSGREEEVLNQLAAFVEALG